MWLIETRQPDLNRIFPQSYCDYHFDIGLREHERELFQLGRFFILATQRKRKQPFFNQIYFAIDMECSQGIDRYLFDRVQFKTKLLFEIKCSTWSGSCNVGSTYTASRPETGKWSGKGYKVRKYFSRKMISHFEVETLEQFSNHPEWLIMCIACRGNIKIPTPSDGISLEKIFLKILSPNSTIIDNYAPLPNGYKIKLPPSYLVVEEGSLIKQLMDFKQGYHFVTCAMSKREPGIGMGFLVSAFDNPIWILLGVSCVLSEIASCAKTKK